MNLNSVRVLTLVAALGCGMASGVFFAFSSFVMRGLARLPAPQGIAAMNSISVTAVMPPFMIQLFGTALFCLILGGIALTRRGEPGAMYVLVGAGLYLVGNILVTMFCNVPLNDALAATDANSAAGAELWRRFLAEWMLYNHVRTITGALAAAALFLALLKEWGR